MNTDKPLGLANQWESLSQKMIKQKMIGVLISGCAHAHVDIHIYMHTNTNILPHTRKIKS